MCRRRRCISFNLVPEPFCLHCDGVHDLLAAQQAVHGNVRSRNGAGPIIAFPKRCAITLRPQNTLATLLKIYK